MKLLKLMIIAVLSTAALAACQTVEEDYDQYDTSSIFGDINDRASGGGN